MNERGGVASSGGAQVRVCGCYTTTSCMPAPQPNSRIARFGVFEADLRTGQLTSRGARIRLQDQPFQVLAALLEKRTLTPLKMWDTTFYPNPGQCERLMTGAHEEGPCTITANTEGSSGLYSTPADMVNAITTTSRA